MLRERKKYLIFKALQMEKKYREVIAIHVANFSRYQLPKMHQI
jgi:hypothetical protein